MKKQLQEVIEWILSGGYSFCIYWPFFVVVVFQFYMYIQLSSHSISILDLVSKGSECSVL